MVLSILKILLNLNTIDIHEKDIIELCEPFKSEGYTVFNFQFPLNEYYLDMINTLLNYLSSEYSVSPYQTRIVLQSNIGNLLIAWYRLYNDVIDDFILLDNKLVDFKSKDQSEQILLKHLSSFSAIEDDECHDRFYYRGNQLISQKALTPFMESYQYDLLKPFNEIVLDGYYSKEKVEKEYLHEDRIFKRITAEFGVDRSIDFSKGRAFNNKIQINEISKPQGYFFVLQYILNLPINDTHRAQAALMMNQQLNDLDRQKVTEYINNYLVATENMLSFKQVINYYSFLVMLGIDKEAMGRMLKFLKKDSMNLDNHYAPFTNALFYITKANQIEHEDYFLDRVEIMRKLKAYYKPKLKVKAHSMENHLVIVTGQLLSYNHAPTKVTIDYANNLLKFNPKLSIKIVVEDMFNYSPNELFFVYPFSSTDSKTLSGEHNKLLHKSIEIHYSNCSLPRKQRLQDDINAITTFNPKWILKIGAPDSLAVDQLYDYYPVSSFSMGGAEYSKFVDMSFGGRSRDEVLVERKDKGLASSKYLYEQHNYGLDLVESKKNILREEYDFSADDFVLVTVGNRLDVELTKDFVEGIGRVIINNKSLKIKWLIVGIEDHHLVRSNKELLKNVKFIKYSEDLMRLYKICHVYVNPFRKGGGISVAMSMFAGLPVVNLIGANDANIYVSQEKAKTLDDYFIYIEKLATMKEFYKAESTFFRKRILNNFTFKSAVENVMKFLNTSNQEFSKRKK